MKIKKGRKTKLNNLQRAGQLLDFEHRSGLAIEFQDVLDLSVQFEKSAVSQKLQHSIDYAVSIIEQLEKYQMAETYEDFQEKLRVKISPYDVAY